MGGAQTGGCPLVFLGAFVIVSWTVSEIYQSPPKGAGILVPREKCRKVLKIISDPFLTVFDSFCPARKFSKNVEICLDTFWRFLTWPLYASPFCGLLNLGRERGRARRRTNRKNHRKNRENPKRTKRQIGADKHQLLVSILLLFEVLGRSCAHLFLPPPFHM